MKLYMVLAGFALVLSCFVFGTSDMVHAEKVLGTGTASLLGGDLTDPEDDGSPETDEGYNAIFSANDEPGFGGGENAFNVFDNRLGPSNDKWCCGRGGGILKEGLHVTAEFEKLYALTHFTVSSANDYPERDPTEWEVQGSVDGEEFTTIYAHDGDSFWDQRLQVVLFEAGKDFDVQKVGYRFFRHVTFNTVANPNGAYFQIGEIEFFSDESYPVDPKAKLTTTWGSIKKVR